MKDFFNVVTVCAVAMLLIWISVAEAGTLRLGLLAADEGLGEVAQAAYDWADSNYESTLLTADGAGNFSDTRGNNQPLDMFAVLWLHYSETNSLPDAFLTDETKKAILDYVESGGALFLTALGLQYTFELEVQTDPNPRLFSPLGKDPPEIGILPNAEGADHPIFSGFDTSNPIFLCSMAQDGFTSDFMNTPDLQGTLLATKTRGGGAGAGERPVVELDVGQGKIMTLGHHNAVYTDTKSEESENLRKLTTNIIEYLAANSAFLAVEFSSKSPATWGKLKSR